MASAGPGVRRCMRCTAIRSSTVVASMRRDRSLLSHAALPAEVGRSMTASTPHFCHRDEPGGELKRMTGGNTKNRVVERLHPVRVDPAVMVTHVWPR